MNKINFRNAKFIKLGEGGNWEKECIDNGTMRFGFNNPYHKEVIDKNYDNVKGYFTGKGKSKGEITKIINATKSFYESGGDVLWITFFRKKLYWTIAKGPATLLEDGSRSRKTEFGWVCKDICGNDLTVDRLSGKLCKVQMFRGTICDVIETDYLRRKINCETNSDVKNVQSALLNLESSLVNVIKSLTWQDFEILVDLIFSVSGYRRIGDVGKVEKDIDLDLILPVNGKKAFVQIKAASNQIEFNEYYEWFLSNETYDEMYYVVHSINGKIDDENIDPNAKVIGVNKIVKMVISAGLTQWVIDKSY